MITNFTKKIGLAAAISIVASSSATAAVFNASASFRTIPDVTITEVGALSFGTGVSGKASTDCILVAAIAAQPAAIGTATPNADVAIGVYNIGGAPSTTVTILMATAIDNDFTFAPAGDYGDANAAANDIVTTYFADAPFNASLSATGKGLLTVGGTLNILNELTASTSFSIAYNISVVY
jgi:hypothetical protein